MEITEINLQQGAGPGNSFCESVNECYSQKQRGRLDLGVKDSGISVHFLIRKMKSVGEHAASYEGEGYDMGESRRECGNPE